MRVFQTQAMWDAKEGKWYEVYSVDQESVTQEEYFRELEVEQCLENDEIDEVEETSYCKCCSCEVEDCDDFECTCNNESEDYIDNDLVIQCDCPDCIAMREEDTDECFCEECNVDREQELITECLDFVFDNDEACVRCTIDKIIETFYKFKELGKLEIKQDMKEFLED